MIDVLASSGVFHAPELGHGDVNQIADQLRLLPRVGIEVIFYEEWYADAGVSALFLATAGLRTPVLHLEKEIGPDFASDDPAVVEAALARFIVNCKFARAIGAELLVFHLWGLPDSDHRIERNLAVLPRCADIAEQFGLKLSIETVLCGASTPVEVSARCLAVEPRVGITLDTAFLAIQGQLLTSVEDDRLWTTGRGVDHVHLKDYADPAAGFDPRGYLHPGRGSLPLDDFLGALTARGFDGSVTLEASSLLPDLSPDAASVEQSMAWLRQRLP